MHRFALLPSERLREIYLAAEHTDRDRQEALWEYWSRITRRRGAFDLRCLLEAFDTGLVGLGNVVGALAVADLLPAEGSDVCEARLQELAIPDRDWGLRMLRARAVLRGLAQGRAVDPSQWPQVLLGRGLSWAVEEAAKLVAGTARRVLLERAADAGCFPKHQRQRFSHLLGPG